MLLFIIENYSQTHMSQTLQQQLQKATHKQLIAKFRQYYPPTVTVMDHLVSYFKILGGHFISGLSTFYKKIQSKLKSPEKQDPKQKQTQENKIKQDKQKRQGRQLDFNQFQFIQMRSQPGDQLRPIPQPIQVSKRDFGFRGEQFQDSSQKGESDQDLELFAYKMSKKKIKVDEQDRKLIEIVMKESPHVKKHFNQLSNQLVTQLAQIYYEERPLREKEQTKKSQVDSIEEEYSQYLRRIGLGRQSSEQGSSYTKLTQLLKQRREIVQKRPMKKKVHVQQDLPPIYDVKKVLSVLETQKEQFMKQKRLKLQQQERLRKELQRQQEQIIQQQTKLQLEKKLRYQKEEREMMRQHYQEIEKRKRLLAQINASANNEQNLPNSSSQLVMPTGQPNKPNNISQDEGKQSSISLQKQYIQHSVQIKPAEQIGSPIRNNNQGQCSTPPVNKRPITYNLPPLFKLEKVANELRNASSTINADQTENENKNTPPPPLVNKMQQVQNETLNPPTLPREQQNFIKNNPFLNRNTSPMKGPTIDDFIKNNNPSSLFAQIQQPNTPTVGSLIFGNNPNKVVNLFTAPPPNPMPSQNIPQSAGNQPIGFNAANKTIHRQPDQNHSPLSISNNPGTIHNGTSPFSVNQFRYPPGSVNSGPAAVGRSPSSFLGSAFSPNPETVRNLFLAPMNSQSVSLFGPPSNQPSGKDSKGRKGKNTIRIS